MNDMGELILRRKCNGMVSTVYILLSLIFECALDLEGV
jgi:hypothetical protein